MKDVAFTPKHLPKELKSTVRKVSALLGCVISESEGVKFYNSIESYRQSLKKCRFEQNEKHLTGLMKKLSQKGRREQYKIAHAFALLLELINCAESAYRTWRLRHAVTHAEIKGFVEIDFVLTAHPTEARSKEVVVILRQITDLLVMGLQNELSFNETKMLSLLRILWQLTLAKTKSPTVMNEADYIYSLVFTEDVTDFILSQHRGYQLRLSTWVGGDKDGHPGVDDKTMLACLEGSRCRLLNIIDSKLKQVMNDIKQCQQGGRKADHEIMQMTVLRRSLVRLKKINTADGLRVTQWQKKYKYTLSRAKPLITEHHQILMINQLIEQFPALVLPMELREDARRIAEATTNRDMAISRMLKTIYRMATGKKITSYVHALIVSNCTSSQDMTHANRLVKRFAKTGELPIVPLFESKEALLAATDILRAWLNDKANKLQIKRQWHNRFEVMLGYSDSSKQIGVLPSRYLIRQAMFTIERLLKRHGIQPVFFQGAGGSVDRGGGSLGEQVGWWPEAAIKRPTLTIQGEMVQRTFSTPEILNSHCQLLTREASYRKQNKVTSVSNSTLEKLVNGVENEYRKLISDIGFINQILAATPFHYLNLLKIGSRPARRSAGEFTLSAFRAIPWVLCWTQTRVLWPTWWGTGVAWMALSYREQFELKRLYKTDPFFASYVKALGFTLSKVEMSVWGKYLSENLAPKEATFAFHYFEHELYYAKRFLHEVSGSNDLVSHRLWLQESIRMRSPYVHILNLLQIIAMKNHDEKLMKETLVGIACGMLTTG